MRYSYESLHLKLSLDRLVSPSCFYAPLHHRDIERDFKEAQEDDSASVDVKFVEVARSVKERDSFPAGNCEDGEDVEKDTDSVSENG